MSIKADRWIRKMCREHRMIEPFEEKQVRTGAISYGVSSYGYDIRIADEFKIFTNVNSTIVDPKNIDSNSMVDFRGPACVIPPNSFALGRSVEYFRVPRNVLCVTTGKSTYARCFAADTKVALVDGSTPSLEEMASRAERGESFWGYSLGPYGRIQVTSLLAPRRIGRDQLLEVALDNGERIRSTPDHVFIRRDGREVVAEELKPNDALMPLYRQLVRGYESVYQPLNGHLDPTHRLADEWNVLHGVYPDAEGTHRQHRDGRRTNNAPPNIERMPVSDHIRLHNAKTFGESFDRERHRQSIRTGLATRMEDPAWRETYRALQSSRARRFWNEEAYVAARARLVEIRLASWTPERRERQADAMRRYFSEPAHRESRGSSSREAWSRAGEDRRERQRILAGQIRRRSEISREMVRAALVEEGTIRGAARRLGCDRSVFRRFADVLAEARGSWSGAENHRVASISELPGDHDVFCLSVPEAGNFALAAGVFVHNCGIITNVTPFEPEWEGFVTLEISNTTPLPAKIYSNEGIAQVLFFESDEECEVSYKDKAGKYQSQTGITLPRL